MPLAAILGLCALLASPGGRPAMQSAMLWQETQPQQPSSEPGSLPEQQATPEQAQPEPQRTLEQGTKPEQPAPQHTPPESTQPPENVPPSTVPEKSDCSNSAVKGKKRNSKHKGAAQTAAGPRKTVRRRPLARTSTRWYGSARGRRSARPLRRTRPSPTRKRRGDRS